MGMSIKATLVLLLIVFGPNFASAATDRSSGSVDITYTITLQGEKPQSIKAKVYFTKDKARIESDLMPGAFPKAKGGGKNIVVVDGIKMAAYAIIPGMTYALMYKLESLAFSGGKPAGHPGDVLNEDRYPMGTKIAKTGSKAHKGIPVTVYTVTFPGSAAKNPLTLYVNSAGMPVYIFGKVGTAPFSTVFRNYRFYKPAANLFRLPKDLPVVDISGLEKILK